MAQDPEQEVEAPRANSHAWLLALLVLAPLLFLLAKIGQFGFGFPYWDAWRFVEILERADAGVLSLADLWSQHNEHRIFFPRLVMLVLAQLSGWNVWWEVGTGAFFATVTALAVGRLYFRTASEDWTARGTAAALISAFTFSWTQNECWVWGFTLQIWLCLAAVALGALALASTWPQRARLAVGIACGAVATGSYANGLLFWPAMLPLVWAARETHSARLWALGAWLIAGALAIAVYFWDYRQPEVSPSLLVPLQNPMLFVQFASAMLGAPVSTLLTQPAWHGVDASVPPWALLPGPLGLAAFSALAWRQWRARRDWDGLAPWLALAAFALGSVLLASAGRCGFGLGQALTSRYIPVTTFFWFALIILGVQSITAAASWRAERGRAVAVGVCAALVLGAIAGAGGTSAAHEQRCHWKRMGWLAVRLGLPHPLFLRDLSDVPEQLGGQILPWLAEHRYCGLNRPLPQPGQYAAAFQHEAERLDALGLAPQAKIYREVAARLTTQP